MYTQKHCEKLLTEIEFFGLEVYPGFYAVRPDEWTQIYNGIGPDAMPAAMRDELTARHPELEAATLIHDGDYHNVIQLWARGIIGRTDAEAMTLAADRRFYANCRILTLAKCAWWSPRRYRLLLRVRAFYKAVRAGGFWGITQAVIAAAQS